jgi:hypothetical protein
MNWRERIAAAREEARDSVFVAAMVREYRAGLEKRLRRLLLFANPPPTADDVEKQLREHLDHGIESGFIAPDFPPMTFERDGDCINVEIVEF